MLRSLEDQLLLSFRRILEYGELVPFPCGPGDPVTRSRPLTTAMLLLADKGGSSTKAAILHLAQENAHDAANLEQISKMGEVKDTNASMGMGLYPDGLASQINRFLKETPVAQFWLEWKDGSVEIGLEFA